MWWLLVGIILSAGLGLEPAAVAQAAENPVPQQKYQFFSGRVVEVAEESLSVRRTLPGREPELRKFTLTATTKIDGELQVSSRVIVAYVHVEESVVARRIIVRRPRE